VVTTTSIYWKKNLSSSLSTYLLGAKWCKCTSAAARLISFKSEQIDRLGAMTDRHFTFAADAETKMQLLKLCIERLTSEGYVYIGMDHFALSDDELAKAQREQSLQRNFQGCGTRARVKICGFGISSISQGSVGFRQNVKDLASYRACLAQGKLPICKGYELTDEVSHACRHHHAPDV
jgi:coproporphyrinogen III oxidase-like Fe-S oxidoreductase